MHEPKRLPVVDPDNVQETICDGPFHALVYGQLVTLTFTHDRPKPDAAFAAGHLELESVVRARLVLTKSNVAALRDYLAAIIEASESSALPAGGIVRH